MIDCHDDIHLLILTHLCEIHPLPRYVYLPSCPQCRDHKPERCPLIRQGIMPAPQEFARRVDRDEQNPSAKEDALEELAEWIPSQLPFGSVALLRVESSENRGQDVVPVIVARKAACPWISSKNAVDGMFRQGDTIVWVIDLPLAQEHRQRQEYLVPSSVSGESLGQFPLRALRG